MRKLTLFDDFLQVKQHRQHRRSTSIMFSTSGPWDCGGRPLFDSATWAALQKLFLLLENRRFFITKNKANQLSSWTIWWNSSNDLFISLAWFLRFSCFFSKKSHLTVSPPFHLRFLPIGGFGQELWDLSGKVPWSSTTVHPCTQHADRGLPSNKNMQFFFAPPPKKKKKLTCQWKKPTILKMYFLLNMGIFRCHGSFRKCKYFWKKQPSFFSNTLKWHQQKTLDVLRKASYKLVSFIYKIYKHLWKCSIITITL